VRKTIVQNERFHNEKFFVERVHNLITDFIYKLPEKIKDMRNKNEEVVKYAEESYTSQPSTGYISNPYLQAYQQSMHRPPANVAHEITNHDFEDFLNLVSRFIHIIPFRPRSI
jgi:hypothetical protein